MPEGADSAPPAPSDEEGAPVAPTSAERLAARRLDMFDLAEDPARGEERRVVCAQLAALGVVADPFRLGRQRKAPPRRVVPFSKRRGLTPTFEEDNG